MAQLSVKCFTLQFWDNTKQESSMKYFLIISLLGFTLTSSANEKMSEIASSKKVSQLIEDKIKSIEADDCLTLNCYLDKQEVQMREQLRALESEEGVSLEEVQKLKNNIGNKMDAYREIGDLDVVKSMEILKLQRFQTSSNALFFFSRVRYKFFYNFGLSTTLSPFGMTAVIVLVEAPLAILAVALDVILLPITYPISAISGF